MATFALVIGLVVGNLLHPGTGLQLSPYQESGGGESNATVDFLMSLIPGDIPVLPTLVIALLVGFALQSMGKAGEPVVNGIRHIQAGVFKLMTRIMGAAPVGAVGAIAAGGGDTGGAAVRSAGIRVG